VTLGALDTVAIVWARPHRPLGTGAGVGPIDAAGILHHATASADVRCQATSVAAEVREFGIVMGHDGSLGEVLRALREAKGWTQAEAGRRIGVAGNTVSRWELGQTEPAAIQRARALEVYGLVDAPLLPQALRELDERVAALERWRRELDERSGPGRS
jgi:DNA-binding XRE family transcriptional regulator